MTNWGRNFDRDAEANLPSGWHVEGQVLGFDGGMLATANHPEHGNVAAWGYNLDAAIDNLVLICSGDPETLELGHRTYIKFLSAMGWTAGWGRRAKVR